MPVDMMGIFISIVQQTIYTTIKLHPLSAE